MTTFPLTRPAAVLLATLVLALAGCGKGEPTKAADKPADPKPPGPTPPGPTPPGPGVTPPVSSTPSVIDPRGPVQAAAEKFVKDLREGAVSTDRLTPGFLKVIGKPTLSPPEKAQGYSAGTADAWLKRAGAAMTGIGSPPTGYGGAGVAVFTGTFNNGAGRFLLRLVETGGAWKADWFQLGSAKAADPAPAAPDQAFQDFAVQAFLDALTGSGAASRDDRVPLLGGAISPKLRQAWAAPFDQDKDRGYDYNPAKLEVLADSLGGGATSYTRTPAGADQFKVELVKGGTPKAFTLKVAKGPNPGEWLVDEFTPQ